MVEGVPLKKTLNYSPVGGLLVCMKALEIYKKMENVSLTLQDMIENDFDALSNICVAQIDLEKSLQSTTT